MRNRNRVRLVPLLLLGIGLATASCRDLAQLVVLSAGIGREFHVTGISSNLSGSHLTIVFENSRFAADPEPVRAATAREVAEYVRDHYPGYPELQQVTIQFGSGGSSGGFSSSLQAEGYTFTPADLGPAAGP
ncbi:MAG TPA: hypothetical protein VEW03_06835 [Longimicrobiaceae bacterium]|nr:hypothetical protein [Longimicrobiaceae bacterium]